MWADARSHDLLLYIFVGSSLPFLSVAIVVMPLMALSGQVRESSRLPSAGGAGGAAGGEEGDPRSLTRQSAVCARVSKVVTRISLFPCLPHPFLTETSLH